MKSVLETSVRLITTPDSDIKVVEFRVDGKVHRLSILQHMAIGVHSLIAEKPL